MRDRQRPVLNRSVSHAGCTAGETGESRIPTLQKQGGMPCISTYGNAMSHRALKPGMRGQHTLRPASSGSATTDLPRGGAKARDGAYWTPAKSASRASDAPIAHAHVPVATASPHRHNTSGQNSAGWRVSPHWLRSHGAGMRPGAAPRTRNVAAHDDHGRLAGRAPSRTWSVGWRRRSGRTCSQTWPASRPAPAAAASACRRPCPSTASPRTPRAPRPPWRRARRAATL